MICRHLSREQKRVLIAESLRADPILRDRDHARRCGASHVTVGRVRAEEGIPTPDEVIRAYVAENPGKSWREYERELGADQKTVKAAAEGAENGQVDQNPHPSPDPDPEPPAPSWEPAGHPHTNAPQAP